MKKITSFLFLFFFAIVLNAQDVIMADQMRENGKIYVVIFVMLTILSGLIIYLVRLDRKISKLEKK